VGIFSHPDLISRSANPEHKWGLYYVLFPPEGATAYDGGAFTQLFTQLTGVVACGIYVVLTAGIAWLAIKATVGMRVSREEEIEGLDIGEHGNEAYHGFVMSPSNVY
jgi:Amt family ammonium transporter